MNTTIALVRDTFREAFARRIFWGFFGCCTALLLFLMFIMRIDVVQGAIATVTIFGRATPSADVQNLVQQTQSVIAMITLFPAAHGPLRLRVGGTLWPPSSSRGASSFCSRNPSRGRISCSAATSATYSS